ncbi:MAG: sulfate adenylyltransferase subunit CysN [Helicobacteraceae bacterium]|nr:sulfate adenylyltransferase subunit CysN [Helicobacteraceae bacterium]
MKDVTAYIKIHEQKELLRFIACGSVDDGKSTLIGRLLSDSKTIYEDQLADIERESEKFGSAPSGEIDLALLTDGLQAEREQGITIDVAYRYFSTDKRKFIIADAPGHSQYTRNMATGASTSDLAIILIDARKGVLEQTKRHTYIVHLLGIQVIAVAINKMDAVGFDKAVFDAIASDYDALAKRLGLNAVYYFPISALKGDNVVEKSANMAWYKGEPLLRFLETTPIDRERFASFRFCVQTVIRPDQDFRGFAGSVASGVIASGDRVVALPSGGASRVKRIVTSDGDLSEASAGMAIALVLEDEIDVSRGDMFIKASEERPQIASAFLADVVWLSEAPLELRKRYLLKLGTKTFDASVTSVEEQIDVETLGVICSNEVGLNAIACVKIATEGAAVFDAYRQNRSTGAFILIDRLNNATLAAGMIKSAISPAIARAKETQTFSAFELELNALIRKHFPHWNAQDISAL